MNSLYSNYKQWLFLQPFPREIQLNYRKLRQKTYITEIVPVTISFP